MPAAALRTSGFPLGQDFILPSELRNRPAPPPQTGSQPFAYRFRSTVDRTFAVPFQAEYHPELQIALIDGKLPTMGLPTIQPTIAGVKPTIEIGEPVIADPIPDRKRD